MQGDSYNLGIRIRNNAGNPVTPSDVIDVEIVIGPVRKTYLNGQVTYSNGMWFFPVRQADSFRMSPYVQDSQVRIKWSNGAVEGKKIYGVRILESRSKEVL